MKAIRKAPRITILGVSLLAGASISMGAQTLINLATQARNIDFSKASSTTPEQIGSGLPGTCVAGELFFNLSATAGQNLYNCVATNTWMMVGSGTGLGDPGGSGLVVRTGLNTTRAVAAPVGAVVGTSDAQTLTNKSIAATEVNSGTLGSSQMPALTGDTTSAAGTAVTKVVAVNGGSIPASSTVVGTNASQQVVAAAVQGNGAKVQLANGTTTANDCAKFDGNGNVVDAGMVCGTAGLADPGANGIVKRTANGVTATAVAGSDYQAPISFPLSIANGGTGTASAPSLIGGSNVTISGSWPNQTISATGSVGNFASDSSIANVSASGTKFSVSGLGNILSYAPGITIGDGNAHTISSAPPGSVFYGVTSLAGVAAISINGITPFSWITGQTAPFTFTGSSYKLTDSKVGSIDIAWLAIQTALLTGHTYIPTGNYIIGSVIPLPLYVPAAYDGGYIYGTASTIRGDGPRLSRITAGSDWGSGYSLMICGDPSGTVGNSLGRYSLNLNNFSGDLQGVGFYSSAASWVFGAGNVNINMDGLGLGARLRTFDVESSGFYHDVTIVGDHTKHIRLHTNGGVYGLYLPAPSPVIFADLMFDDFRSEAASIASIGINATATLAANFTGETYLGSAPYGILGESGGCASITSGVQFDSLHFEFMGNALIEDDNVYAGGTYTDANKCRGLGKLQIRDFASSWQNSNFWGGTGARQRRAAIDVATMSMHIDQLDCDAGCWNPNWTSTPSGSAAPLATILIRYAGDGVGVNAIGGNVDQWIASSGSLPLIELINNGTTTPLYYNFKLQGNGWGGYLLACFGVAGNHTAFATGEVVEANGADCGVGGMNSNQPALGIAMQGGPLSNGVRAVGIPVAVDGLAYAAMGWAQQVNGLFKKASGIGNIVTVTAGGSGGTSGTFNWAATGGGCSTEPTGTFTVANGAITAVTITNHGTGCSSSPTISTSASAGLTGATITTVWPSGLVTPASSFADSPIVGTYQGGSVSGTSAGNGAIGLHLQGLH